MTDTCDCCEGLEPLTPLSTANRPGLEQLSYRIGTHATFLETMKARLSRDEFSALKDLKTRDSSDPTIALLDAWALVADVLTFYQERIANEGYLRTATERRSVLELGRLVGYTLRPGVSATVYPAFMMGLGYNKGGEIPKGTRVQSIPSPNEMPQFFETSERIEAREAWNELKPRLTQPQAITIADGSTTNAAKTIDTATLYFQGTATNLKANDPLLLVSGSSRIVRHVKAVEPDHTTNQTKVTLQEPPTPSTPSERATEGINSASISNGRTAEDLDENQNRQTDCAFEKLDKLLEPLTRKPSLQPFNRQRLVRSPQQTFKCQSDMPSRLLATLQPNLSNSLYQAWANLPITEPTQVKVYILRTKASPFGHNAPLRPVSYDEGRRMVVYDEWGIDNPFNQQVPVNASFIVAPRRGTEPLTVQFTNQSTGDITKYTWDFGDESTSTAKDPDNHTFNDSGIYNVTLTVFGPDGSDARHTTTITVTAPPPVASFSAKPTSGTAPLTVQFTNQSTGNITSYSWDFGDGNSSSDQNPSYPFTSVRKYTVTLTVIGSGGSSRAQIEITVNSIDIG
jgi:PKD repeat protein